VSGQGVPKRYLKYTFLPANLQLPLLFVPKAQGTPRVVFRLELLLVERVAPLVLGDIAVAVLASVRAVFEIATFD
jgi:hypothetical protein